MIRPAYPDELGHAQSHHQGIPMPPDTRYLLAIKQHPIERIIATIPWSKTSVTNQQNNQSPELHQATQDTENTTLSIHAERIALSHIQHAEQLANLLYRAVFELCPEAPQTIHWNSPTQSPYPGGQAQPSKHILLKDLVSP